MSSQNDSGREGQQSKADAKPAFTVHRHGRCFTIVLNENMARQVVAVLERNEATFGPVFAHLYEFTTQLQEILDGAMGG